MPEIVVPVRAKAGWLETKRFDKNGKVVKSKQHVVPSNGMFSGHEMEGVMREVAKDAGVDESSIRISTYKQGKAPLEANPRHRGLGTRTRKLVDTPVDVTPQASSSPKRVWGGWEDPANPRPFRHA